MKPPFPTREDFIVAWLALSKAESGSAAYEQNFWAHSEWMDLIHDHPDVAFALILEIWSRDQSIEIAEVLSAGPVEDLLATHGERFIGPIEDQAAKDPSFRKLLGGVWKNAMPDSVWVKIQAIWDRRGWDGIPEEKAQPDGTDNSGATPLRV